MTTSSPFFKDRGRSELTTRYEHPGLHCDMMFYGTLLDCPVYDNHPFPVLHPVLLPVDVILACPFRLPAGPHSWIQHMSCLYRIAGV
jgi:hypothetical protein